MFPVFRFPKPTGPYAIGTVTYHWLDSSRRELFSADPNDKRELMAQVWYPARAEPKAARAAYIQDADVVIPAIARLTKKPGFLLNHLRYVTTNAVPSAGMAEDQTNYPVLIYLSGLGGFRSASTFQIEELVSHGYIVVGLDQPGGSITVKFPDGRQIYGWSKNEIGPFAMQSITPEQNAPVLHGETLPFGILPYFAQDVSFTLEQLNAINAMDPHHLVSGRINLERAGIFGISLGGENAAEACLHDLRLKACLIMDVWIPANVITSSLQQSCMLITRDAATMRLERKRAGGWTENEISLTLTTMRQLYEGLPGDGYYLEIPKMFHLNFTDAPYWFPMTSWLGLSGPIKRKRGFDILNAYSLAFFNRYLKDKPSALLDGPSGLYPEVNIEIRRKSTLI